MHGLKATQKHTRMSSVYSWLLYCPLEPQQCLLANSKHSFLHPSTHTADFYTPHTCEDVRTHAHPLNCAGGATPKIDVCLSKVHEGKLLLNQGETVRRPVFRVLFHSSPSVQLRQINAFTSSQKSWATVTAFKTPHTNTVLCSSAKMMFN